VPISLKFPSERALDIFKANSHMPGRTPAVLRQCRVLRESPCGSWKYPNC
jgi:hypothetical protein